MVYYVLCPDGVRETDAGTARRAISNAVSRFKRRHKLLPHAFVDRDQFKVVTAAYAKNVTRSRHIPAYL